MAFATFERTILWLHSCAFNLNGHLIVKRKGDSRYQGAQVHQKPSTGKCVDQLCFTSTSNCISNEQNLKSENAFKKNSLIQTITNNPH